MADPNIVGSWDKALMMMKMIASCSSSFNVVRFSLFFLYTEHVMVKNDQGKTDEHSEKGRAMESHKQHPYWKFPFHLPGAKYRTFLKNSGLKVGWN